MWRENRDTNPKSSTYRGMVHHPGIKPNCTVIPDTHPLAPAKVQRLLRDIHKQLEAMNCSAAHAASWVEPRAKATTKMLARIEKIIPRRRKHA